MTLFWLLAALLLAAALALLLPALLRQREIAPEAAPAAAPLAVLREQLAQADAEFAAGTIDARQHALARAEIERRVLEERGEQNLHPGSLPQAGAGEVPGAAAPARSRRAAATAWVLALAVPVMAIGLYSRLGNLSALSGDATPPAADAAGGFTQEQVEQMVLALERRLEANPPPDAAQGWQLLARAYASMQRYEQAERAFARATALSPGDAQLLADHADAMAMLRGQTLAGEPLALVERALKLDPDNVKALALAGTAAFERKDYRGALAYWQRARAAAPPQSEWAASLDRSIAEATSAAANAGAASTAVTAGRAVPATSNASATAAAASDASVRGTVRLSSSLAARVAPDDTVFIFARAAEGPRMPLAILKRKARELPIAFTLDDSSAMSPQMRLSMFPSVVVGVRVSTSGNAMPQSGDLVGQSAPLKPGSGGQIELLIDGVQP